MPCKMHIGILSTVNGCDWAGSEETWRIIAEHASEQGHHLSLQVGDTVSTSSKLNRLRASDASIRATSELGAVTRRLAIRGLYNQFQSFFKNRFDVIFVSMGGIMDAIWMPDLMTSLLQTKVPVVLFVQANAEAMVSSEWERNSLRQLYASASKVILLSKHNQELLERQIGERIESAVRVMNPLRSPVAEPVSWPDAGPCYRIAEVARLELADKQQDHLLKALSGEIWRDRDWRLTFYGSGPDEGHIRRLIDFYGLTAKVEIGGFVADFRDIWRENHLHVLPSRREGMPLSLIESMACGRPAVATRAGGSAELVEHGQSGWICPGMHPEVLAETLETAWASRERWQEMGIAARERVISLQEPDWAGRILGILEEAVKTSK